MTHFPPPALHERRKRVLRYLGMGLSALMVLTVLTVFALILRNENAHDEEKCPFTPASDKPFEGGRLVEQQRSCVSGISERRYLVERAGKPSFELARKRLSSERFEPHRYGWDVSTDDKKEVTVRIVVDGKLSSEFRESDAPKR